MVAMNHYLNTKGNSGVSRYSAGSDYIDVEFNGTSVYRYTYASAGKATVEKMKKLAVEGRGLSTYISRKVRENYETIINK